jgi:hypothetical protein
MFINNNYHIQANTLCSANADYLDAGLLCYIWYLINETESFLKSYSVLRWLQNYRHFMKPRSSLKHLKVLATCPCLEPDQSSPCPLSHFLMIHLNIIFHLGLDLPCGLFFSYFPTKIVYRHFTYPYVLHALSNYFFPISPPD